MIVASTISPLAGIFFYMMFAFVYFCFKMAIIFIPVFVILRFLIGMFPRIRPVKSA